MGSRTLGKYRIIAELGHGGMADVLLAMVAGPTGSGFTKLAVVKRLRPNLVEDPEFISMLVDEARISARLNHPNVVQTLEVGVEGNEYYLAMEYLDGQPLHRIQRRSARSNAPLSKSLELLILIDALAGLHHAHELPDYDGTPLSIVHRDVNPQNIFITYDGQVKVVDFGIAKAVGRSAETKQGIVKGKVRYMAPEQAMGREVDRRADIFAAGILLWEAATGKKMWRDLDDLAIVQLVIGNEYDPSPRSVDPSIPEQLDAICRRALAHDPKDRYTTAADLRADLEAFVADDVVAARRELGPKVAELFAKERSELRAIIEQVSKATLEAPSINAMIASSSHPAALASSVSPSGVSNVISGSTNPVVVSHSTRPPEVSSESKGRRFGVGAIAGAGMMFVAFLVAAFALEVGISPTKPMNHIPSAAANESHSLVLKSVEGKSEHSEVRMVWAPAPPSPKATTSASTAAPTPTPIPTPTPPVVKPLDCNEVRRQRVDTSDPWAP